MKFLCDVHISLKISKKIQGMGYQSEHINNILDKWLTKDGKITEYVDKHDLILITKDQDFRNSFLVSQKPKKLIKINLGNLSNAQLSSILENHMDQVKEINRQSKLFMVEINNEDMWVVTK